MARRPFNLFLILAACLVCTTSCSPQKAETVPPRKDGIPVFVATDLHYLSPELHDNGEAFRKMLDSGDGKDTAHCEAIIDAFAFGLPRPSILIVTGDLSFNGEKTSHEALARKFEVLERAGVQVFVLPGNHDLDNPWAVKYSGPRHTGVPSVSASEFAEIYRNCGFEKAISKDEGSLSYYSTAAEGLGILMLDSTKHETSYEQGYPEAGGAFSPVTLRWIDGILANARDKKQRVIVAMHHSLVDHNPMFSEGYTLENPGELIPILQKHGVTFILDGHIHIQSIATFSSENGDISDIATGALSVYPNNYGRLDFGAQSDEMEYRTERLDIAKWARKVGVDDPYLLDYRETSRAYFGGFARRLVDRFGLVDGLTEDERECFMDFMAELNCEFFAGTIDARTKAWLLDKPGSEVVSRLKGSFLSEYVAGILESSGRDNNRY